MKKMIQQRGGWLFMTVLSLLIAVVAVIPYMTFNQADFPDVFDGRFGNGGVSWLYIHIICGGIALIVGPFQFWPWLRQNYKGIHRWLGRIYYFLGIFPASISGLIVAFGTVAGLTGAIGFSLLAILWAITGVAALIAIKNGRVRDHQQWMIRNFALTFAAVTLRIWIPILMVSQIAGGNIPEDVAFMGAYQTVAWLSWVPNLIVAEWMIARQNSANKNRTGDFVTA